MNPACKMQKRESVSEDYELTFQLARASSRCLALDLAIRLITCSSGVMRDASGRPASRQPQSRDAVNVASDRRRGMEAADEEIRRRDETERKSQVSKA